MTGKAEWQGPVGDVWAQEWRRTDRSFAALASTLDAAIQAAAPAGPGVALDVGCGAGATSLALGAARPDLTVLGIDVSEELIDVARGRAREAGLANVRFAVADLEELIIDGTAPAVICSRHGVMFAADPIAMFARLHRLAAPGASLVFSCFREPARNPWAGWLAAIVTDAPQPMAPAAPGYRPGPFGFADADIVRTILAEAGWRAIAGRPVDYAYLAGAGTDPVANAAGFFARIGPVAAALREAEGDRAVIEARLTAELSRHCDGEQVVFPAAAWLWSARA